jgi:probable HAF family extracellular repeat protein
MNVQHSFRPLLCALALWGATTASPAASLAQAPAGLPTPAAYTLIDLGTLGGSFSSAAAVNNKRQVVGRSWRNDLPECLGSEEDRPCEYAFLWQGGQLTDLGHAQPNGLRTYPTAINAKGVVVGFEELPAPAGDNFSVLLNRPFVYLSGVFQTLPLLSGKDTAEGLALAVNVKGVATGFSQEDNRAQTLVTWTDGVVERGAVDKGVYRRGLGINKQGTIAGWQYLPNSFRPSNAFVQQRGKVVNLSAADTEIWSEAMDINDAGLVVGNQADAAFRSGFATEWRLEKGAWVNRRIGALKGHDHSTLNRVNNSGVSVGYSEDSANGIQRAIAVFDGQLVDLSALLQLSPAVLTNATGINDLGDIVGEARFNGGPPHAFLLLRR